MRLRKSLLQIVFLLLHTVICNGQDRNVGTSYFGTKNYIEYIHGDFPLLITIGHCGSIKPTDIPDRNCDGKKNCSILNDKYTMEMGLDLVNSIKKETGKQPFVVIVHLHRVKLDVNRSLSDATNGLSDAQAAWTEFHSFVDTARVYMMKQFGAGLYIDWHGHANKTERVEFGTLLTANELRSSATAINSIEYRKKSSQQYIVNNNKLDMNHSDFLWSTQSLGGMLDALKRYNVVPSSTIYAPVKGESYNDAGYNMEQHTSFKDGTVDGIQVEVPKSIRFDENLRKQFVADFAFVLIKYVDKFYKPMVIPSRTE